MPCSKMITQHLVVYPYYLLVLQCTKLKPTIKCNIFMHKKNLPLLRQAS